jgi:hypothetical protein
VNNTKTLLTLIHWWPAGELFSDVSVKAVLVFAWKNMESVS